MDIPKCTSSSDAHVLSKARFTFTNKVHLKAKVDGRERPTDPVNEIGADIDLKEVYFLIMHFLSDGPCQQTCEQFRNELMEHQLLPRRYHAGFPRNAVHSEDDNGISSPLSYSELVERYPHIEKDHLVKLLKQLILSTASPLHGKVGRNSPSAADVPTLLGTGSFSLLDSEKNAEHKHVKPLPTYMRWPHTQVDQVRGLSLREIGGGFTKHHRPPSLRSACYVIAKPSTMVQKMETTKQLRGHRDAVYCAIFDRSGRYVITGSDDRLVKIWSMDTALCLTSCRGHEGDITDLAVSSNNDLVASAANDFVIRVWRLPDGLPISVLRGHTGAVTAIAFSPRHCYNLLSSSDDGTCRIWDVKSSQSPLGIYVPKPADAIAGRSSGASSNGTSSTNAPQSRQILCCAYNAMGTVFVTGSSDTYARVWDACRFRTTDSGQPIHEMGILSGHENDVNYVQFSGCAVVSRSSTPKDNISSKKDLLCCDNIVTCSRDGSAIIWVPRLRRCHGKPERCWIRAYHLKVPPPPLLPQRPRGGPRQRLLPTPRGVNMIVWSLDDRFVLAAIMDCRICVWNAIDGSLVHSLTGHRASSYVLDVHPFNPRIAMSAGYDGLTIVWDIWEGTPIRIFEIGGYKLVDGKFSPDGTSIVLSDDVGQIYLISTGQGEFCKDAKYDQFFLGDYRPLIRDPAGNVLDQETQLTPYQRNGEDLLCDSSMIPYPEPYQSMYQQRRFGALCKTRQRQASSMKFAIGLDIRLDHDYEMPPLADLQGMIEPIPEFLDAMYFEPENEVMSDNNDSEYNVPEEFFSEGEQGGKSASSFSDSECSTEDSDVEHIFKDGLRRSGRRNHSTEIESMTSSKRRAKKRNLEDRAGSTSRSNRTKRSKFGRAVSKRKSSKASTVRPQRVAALNALNMFAHTSGTSAGEDEDDSEDGSSGSESVLHYSNIQLIESDKELQNRQWKCTNEERPPLQFEDVPKHPDTQSNIGNRKRLVFKISLRDSKKSTPSEEIRPKCDDAVDLACPSFMSQEANERIGATSKDPRSSFADAIDLELSQNCNNDINGIDAQNETKVKQEQDVGKNKGLCFPNDAQKCTPLETSEQDNHRYKVKQEQDVEKNDEILNKKYEDLPGSSSFRDHDSLEKDKEVGTNNSYESKPNPPPKSTKLTIKIKSPSKLKFVHAVDSLTTANSAVSSSQSLHPEVNVNRHDVHKRGKSHKARTNFDDLDVGMEGSTSNAGNHFDSGMKLPETARRTRSMMGSTSREPSAVNHSYNVRGGYELRTSVNADQITTEEWMGNAKLTVRSRSSRSGQGGYYDNNPNYSYQRESSHPPPKASWLMLSEIEEGYRYIPQLGDEVIYLRQGHEQYISSSNASSDSPPWELFRGKNIGAVEICKLEEIEYLVIQGSGDSGCKITLKFVDPASSVYNESFKLTLPELVSTPDFVIEKTLYDAAIERQWTVGDTCKVWWWNEAGDGTGTWWDGAIVSSNPNSPEFSNSPWERYEVRYKDGNTTPHGPWELHDPDVQFQWPHIDCESINKLLNLFAKLEKSASKNQDRYGFQKLNQVAQKSDFINSFPVPLYPEVIRLRLKNKYYRTMEAVNHDIKVMLANAEKYFERSTELSSKVKRLSGWFRKKLSKFS